MKERYLLLLFHVNVYMTYTLTIIYIQSQHKWLGYALPFQFGGFICVTGICNCTHVTICHAAILFKVRDISSVILTHIVEHTCCNNDLWCKFRAGIHCMQQSSKAILQQSKGVLYTDTSLTKPLVESPFSMRQLASVSIGCKQPGLQWVGRVTDDVFVSRD